MKFVLEGSEDEVKIIRVRLESGSHGIDLIGTDNEGKEWFILTLKDGKYERHTSIDANIGFELDLKGRIKEYRA